MISAQGHGQSLVHEAFVCSHRDTDPAKLLPGHSEVKQGLPRRESDAMTAQRRGFLLSDGKKKQS